MELVTALPGVLLAAVLSAPGRAQVADERGQIGITLVAAGDEHRVAGEVAIRGPVITSCESGPDGRASFDGLPPGRYVVRASAPGYRPSAATVADLREGRLSVTIVLGAQLPTRRIGRVTTAVSERRSEADIARTLTTDTLEAAGHVSGVSSTFGVDTAEVPPTISLEGHAEQSVAQTIDGLPLGAPGLRSALRYINPDLINAMGATFGPVPGSSGGAIDFRTLDPTLAWNGQLGARRSAFGGNGLDISERGSFGSIGVVYAHADRVNRGAIDGHAFRDASGSDFTHAQLGHDIGDLVKLRVPLSTAGYLQTLIINDARTSQETCGSQTAAVPCSFGPHAWVHERLRLVAEQAVATIGSAAVNVSLSRTDSMAADISGVPAYASAAMPALSTTQRTVLTAFSAGADIPLATHQLSLRVRTGTVQRSFEQNGATVGDGLRYQIAAAADRLRLSALLSTTLNIATTRTNYGGNGSSLSSQTVWSTRNAGRFAFALAAGAGDPQASNIDFTTDPSLLEYSCRAHAAFGATAGDAPGNPAQRSARAAWSGDFPNGAVTLTAFTQSVRNATIPALANASALGWLPAGYVAAATAAYADPLVCGDAPGAGRTPAVYLSTFVSGASEQFNGLRLDSDLHLRRLRAHVFADALEATAASADPRLTSATTLTPSGSQILGVPRLSGGVDLSYQWPGVRGLVSVTGSAANNARNLPAYALLTAGIEKPFAGGVASAYVTNVFNTYSGLFATTALGLPLRSGGGIAVPFAGIPFAPRELHVAIRFGVGPDRVGLSSGSALPAQAGNVLAEPRIAGFPSQPPAQPFRVAADAAGCTRESAALDRQIFDPIARFVATLEHERAAAVARPASTTLTPLQGVDVHYVAERAAYSLIISTGRIDALRAIAACNFLHIGSAEEAQHHDVYIPPAVNRFRQKIMFAPALGLYLVKVAQPEHDDLRVYALSANGPPDTAFGLRAACPAEVRPTVEAAVEELSRYFVHDDVSAARSWRIVKHTAAGGSWYSLYNNDTAVIHGLIACSHVSGAAPAELAQRGLGAQPQPYLNYAPQVGLYVLIVGLDAPPS